mgnify:CR=1 FL=1
MTSLVAFAVPSATAAFFSLLREAVTDAAVSVAYSMPPMHGMAPMNYKGNADLQGETYRSTLNFSMSGSWNVEVRAVRAGKTTQVKFNVDVK